MRRPPGAGRDALLLAAVAVVLVWAIAQGWPTWTIALLGVSVALLGIRAGLDVLRRAG